MPASPKHTTLTIDKDFVRDLKILALESQGVGLPDAPKNVTQWIVATMRREAEVVRGRIAAARAKKTG